MNRIRSLFGRAPSASILRSTESRPRVRRAPACEMLEGRQLLSTATSTVASDRPAWDDASSARHWSGATPTAAEIAHFDAKGWRSTFVSKGTAEVAHSGHYGAYMHRALSGTWNGTPTA